MLRRYCSSQHHIGRQIRDAMAAQDGATARLLAHTLKSVSGNVGATAIQTLADQLELALVEGRPAAEIRARLDALEPPLQNLIEALDSQLAADAV